MFHPYGNLVKPISSTVKKYKTKNNFFNFLVIFMFFLIIILLICALLSYYTKNMWPFMFSLYFTAGCFVLLVVLSAVLLLKNPNIFKNEDHIAMMDIINRQIFLPDSSIDFHYGNCSYVSEQSSIPKSMNEKQNTKEIK